VVRKCPSCMQVRDTCEHVLFCDHARRVETLHHMIDLLEVWLEEAGTNPDLLDCISENAYSHGGRSMVDICQGISDQYQQMVQDQDAIGQRRFMEGMICTHMRQIQSRYQVSLQGRDAYEPQTLGAGPDPQAA
jgi:hypothetical protein